MAHQLAVSTAYTRMFYMIDSSDHVSAKTGLTVTVTLSKAGAAFGAAGGTVTEVSSGWYKIALTTTDTNTAGDLAYHCTGSGADPTDFVDQVASASTPPTAAVIADAVWDEARSGHVAGGSFGEGVASVTGAVGSVTGAVGSVTGNVGGNVTGSVGSVAAGGITASSIAADAIGASELAADAANEIADAIFNRASSNFESTAPALSLGAAVIGATHKSSTNAGTGVQTIYKSDDATTFKTRTLTSDASLDPVQAVTKLA